MLICNIYAPEHNDMFEGRSTWVSFGLEPRHGLTVRPKA
jgi:hypothetical protein